MALGLAGIAAFISAASKGLDLAYAFLGAAKER